MEQFISLIQYPAITAAVWVVCFIVKQWIKDPDRKIIPTLAAGLGAVLGFVVVGLTLDGFIAGAFSGLAATGADQMFKQLLQDTTTAQGDK